MGTEQKMMHASNAAKPDNASLADLLKAKLPRIKANAALADAILEKIRQSPQ